MKKFLKRLFKSILYIILIIIILVFLFLLIINNKKFSVYSKYDWDLYRWWDEIILFNDKLEIYPEFKKFNKSDLPEWYEYDWYMIFHLNKMELEWAWISSYEGYMGTNGEFLGYLIKNYGSFSLKSLNYSKGNSDNINFIDKIAAMRNMNPKIWYYQNWQTWYIENYLVNNSYGDKVFNWKRTRYYEDWQIWKDWNYDEWLLDWEWFTYYPDWKVFEYWNFDKWKGNKVYYKKDWEIIGSWKFINNKIYDWLNVESIWLCTDSFSCNIWSTWFVNYSKWIENWDFVAYWNDRKDNPLFDSIHEKWHFENWNLEWNFVVYYESWVKKKECFYVDWIWDCLIYDEAGNEERRAEFIWRDEVKN